jgi:hypothetical protein
MSRCTITPTCQRGQHAAADFPCGGPLHQVGDPCEFCGKPLLRAPDGGAAACSACWAPITIADAKAAFAEVGVSVDIRPSNTHQEG